MNGLDLFSGIGGVGLAIKCFGIRTVAYCESDRYAQGVLLSLMRRGYIDQAPIWDDVRSLESKMLPKIEIITGGFPCQDISVAGLGKGLEGKRSGLFFEIARLTSTLRPRFVFLENVPAITIRGLDRVLLEFSSLGYDARWTIVSAQSVGACHRRERFFLLAHSNSEHRGEQLQPELNQPSLGSDPVGEAGFDSDTDGQGRKGRNEQKQKLENPAGYGQWTSQPSLCRGTHGISNRMDRLKCLGNSVVPVQVKEAFIKLLGMNPETTGDQTNDRN